MDKYVIYRIATFCKESKSHVAFCLLNKEIGSLMKELKLVLLSFDKEAFIKNVKCINKTELHLPQLDETVLYERKIITFETLIQGFFKNACARKQYETMENILRKNKYIFNLQYADFKKLFDCNVLEMNIDFVDLFLKYKFVPDYELDIFKNYAKYYTLKTIPFCVMLSKRIPHVFNTPNNLNWVILLCATGFKFEYTKYFIECLDDPITNLQNKSLIVEYAVGECPEFVSFMNTKGILDHVNCDGILSEMLWQFSDNEWVRLHQPNKKFKETKQYKAIETLVQLQQTRKVTRSFMKTIFERTDPNDEKMLTDLFIKNGKLDPPTCQEDRFECEKYIFLFTTQ